METQLPFSIGMLHCCFSPSNATLFTNTPSALPPASFFPAEATSEILAELLPGLCPFDSNTTWVLECLEAFLPTDLPPELYEHGWKLWLPQLTALLQVMENGGAWDQVSLWTGAGGRDGGGGGYCRKRICVWCRERCRCVCCSKSCICYKRICVCCRKGCACCCLRDTVTFITVRKLVTAVVFRH